MALGPADRHLLLATLDVRDSLADVDVSRVDWRAVTAVARASHMLPTLADRALSHAAWQIDAESRALLTHALKETTVYNSRIMAELARAASILRAANIDFVVLKGAALLAEHYPRITLRHTVDLDLLIDPTRYEDSISALYAAGYVDDPHYTDTLVGDGSSMAEAWPSRMHARPPLKGPSGATVDPHHRVPITDFESCGGFRGFFERSHAWQVHGTHVQMCDRNDLAAHLCEHFALQHHADPTDAPRLLCDLHAMFPQGPAWAQLEQGSNAQRISVMLVKALYEAAFARDEARDPMTALLRRVAIADPGITPMLSQLAHLRGHASRLAFNVRTRPRYALRTLFPTREYMAQHHHVDADSPRIYPLYVKRLLTTLWRIR